jgi:Fic family protein
MITYIHERSDWPHWRWREQALANVLAQVRHRQGRLVGRMAGLGFDLRSEATFQTLTEDVVKSSEIEGDILDRDQVRSSLARRLGMEIGALTPADRHVDGVVDMILDATGNYTAPLTAARLFGWHAGLFPTGWSGLRRITVGAWRDDRTGPMQVVSGSPSREHVHFQAPPARLLDAEMSAFLDWFNAENAIDPVLKAGLAHLWFVTIHPFDDGNGRIARAIADQSLARSEASAQRFYSMSAQIRKERDMYYHVLEATQRGDLDVTAWLEWFLSCLERAFGGAEEMLAGVLVKARFWQAHGGEAFNDRQRLLLDRLFDGMAGKLTSSKWAKLAKCSQDTALRDIDDFLRRGILTKDPAGGRSTSYSLAATHPDGD